MFELKSYQQGALDALTSFFQRCRMDGDIDTAFQQTLQDNNFVETIISVAPNLFYGTSIAVTILVLSKHKTDTTTQFIDASGEDFFKKVTNNNMMTDAHIEKKIKQ